MSWFVSRLEIADKNKRDGKGSAAAASDSAVTSRSGSSNVGPPVAGGGTGDVRMKTGSVSRAEDTCGASSGNRGCEGSAITPVDMTTPPLWLERTRVLEECGTDMMLPGAAGHEQGASARGVRPKRASLGLDTAVRRAPTEEERRLEEPDELVRWAISWPYDVRSKPKSASCSRRKSGGGVIFEPQRVPLSC